MKSYQQFFAELKRRHVFRVAAIYGAVAFVVIQVADIVLPRLGLPEWTVTFMVALVILAFPVALILAWAFEMTPEGVRRTEGAAAGEIEGIVAQPASQRWPAGLLALLGVVALLGSGWWIGRRTAPPAAADVRLAEADPSRDDRPSVAVLPFADMSAAGDQEYFGDGMTEEILNTLAKIRELRIAGRTSAFAYKGQDKDLREIGAEIGVDYLVEGSVRKEGDQLRITAQLIDATDGSHVWSDSYDRRLENVFQIQREIAEAVAAELRVPLGLERDELVRPTADVAAYDLFLAGRARMRERGPSLLEAIRLFDAAIAHDSSWAPAWAALAEATELTVWYESAMPEGVPRSDYTDYTEQALDRAEEAARRALVLDPGNASAHVALGSIQRNRARWTESEAAYLRALDLDPDDAETHQQYGDFLLNIGRIAEAVRAMDRAAALDPAPIRLGMLAFALTVDGRFAEAASAYELTIRRTHGEAHRREGLWRLARTYVLLDRWEAAVETVEQANRIDEGGPFQGGGFPIIGSREDVERFFEAVRLGERSQIPAGAMDAMRPEYWLRVGDTESAVDALLEQARELPFGRVIEFRYPYLAPIRSDPRIVAHLAERGLGDAPEIRTAVAERTLPIVLRERPEP